MAIEIDPGPKVTVRVEGTSIPASRQEDLVPVRREGSIDEDLLEDSKRRIEQYLLGRGISMANFKEFMKVAHKLLSLEIALVADQPKRIMQQEYMNNLVNLVKSWNVSLS